MIHQGLNDHISLCEAARAYFPEAMMSGCGLYLTTNTFLLIFGEQDW